MTARAAGAALLVCSILSAPAQASEIWVAPTVQADFGGPGIGSNSLWPATAFGAVRFAWGVPATLQTFQSAKIVLIAHAPGGAATLNVYVCAAASGDPVAGACAAPTAIPFTGVANALVEVDVSAALAPHIGTPGQTHLAVLAYTTPTTATDHIVGLRFAYDPTPPALVGDGSGLTNVNAALLNGLTSAAFAAAIHGHDVAQVTNAARLAGGNLFTGSQTIDGGNFDLDASTATTGNLLKNGTHFLHNFGMDNTFLGVEAGNFSLTGPRNTGVGAGTLGVNTVGSDNTAIGHGALFENTFGARNTAIGQGALGENVGGLNNTAIGRHALLNNVIGTNNVAIGLNAGIAVTGSENIYLGANTLGVAGESNAIYLGVVGTQTKTVIAGIRGTTIASGEVVLVDANGRLGSAPLNPGPGANTFTGTQTIDAGNLDLDASTAATGNLLKNGTRFLHNFGGINATFLGESAGNFTMNPFGDNSGLGAHTLSNLTTGQGNTAVGSRAMRNTTTGSQNVAVGRFALTDNTTGADNAALGDGALNSNTTGSSNTGIGAGALGQTETGFNNVAVGDGALANNIAGANNVAIGHIAGLGATTGSLNIYLGSAVVGSPGDSNTMRLGAAGFLTRTFVAGIRDVTVTGGEMVVIDADGQLGSVAEAPDNTVGSAQVINESLTGDDLAPNSVGNSEVVFNYAGGVSKGGAATDLACGGCVAAGEVSFAFATPGANTFTGTQTINTGNLDVDDSTASTGVITKNGTRFLHNPGTGNTFLGANSGNLAVSGSESTGIGVNALMSLTGAVFNTGIGASALESYSGVAGGNTAVGRRALGSLTSGGSNTAIGSGAGDALTTGSNNLYVDNAGGPNESATIRIGDTQTRAFMAGVRDRTTGQANAIAVVIDSSGQLGTVSSSRRYKEDIHDMGAASRRLLSLRPVTFRYTQAFADGAKPIQFGLIAEEVAEAFPELAVRNGDGQVETVQYQTLSVLLLNEMQQQQQRIDALERQVAALIASLASSGSRTSGPLPTGASPTSRKPSSPSRRPRP